MAGAFWYANQNLNSEQLVINYYQEPNLSGSRNSTESELVKTLSDAGIKLANIKVTKGAELNLASDSGSKNFDGNNSDNSNNSNQQNAFKQSKQGGDRDSQRRQEMWEYYKEKASA